MKKIIYLLFASISIYLSICLIVNGFYGAPIGNEFILLYIFGIYNSYASFDWFPFAPLILYLTPIFVIVFFVSKTKFFEKYNKYIKIFLIIFLLLSFTFNAINTEVKYPNGQVNIERCEKYSENEQRTCWWVRAYTLNDDTACDKISFKKGDGTINSDRCHAMVIKNRQQK